MELLSSTERPNPPLDLFRKRLDALPAAIAWSLQENFVGSAENTPALLLTELIPPGIRGQGATSNHVCIFQTSRGLPHSDGEGAIPSGMRDPLPLGWVVALQQISHPGRCCVGHPQCSLQWPLPVPVTCRSRGHPSVTRSLSSCTRQLQFRKISLTLECFSLDYPAIPYSVVRWLKPNNNILLKKNQPKRLSQRLL